MQLRDTILALVLSAGLLAYSACLAQAAARPDDETITYWIRQALQEDLHMDPSNIKVNTRDGIVTLTGTVHNNAERDHAADVASRLIGVRKVVNEIMVNWGYDDVVLQRRLENRLLANAETHWVAQKIHVAVDQGKVTLSGRVNLWSERQAAGRVAFRTYGVRSVDNQLGVVSPEEGG